MAPPRNSPIVQFDTTPTQSLAQPQNDLIHVTRHLCTLSRIDGINAIGHVVFQGAKQVKKIANASNRGRVCLFFQNNTRLVDL